MSNLAAVVAETIARLTSQGLSAEQAHKEIKQVMDSGLPRELKPQALTELPKPNHERIKAQK